MNLLQPFIHQRYSESTFFFFVQTVFLYRIKQGLTNIVKRAAINKAAKNVNKIV
ncbi:hypothetical protein [Sediminibacterium goheungense]|uniref:Uncharacterized protein n=1 Tax=Sediminibacterium goheungense TaxID=1086393 RepID=A0A4R6J4J9_9BACT|nr:hypothetical protein [Sediminibacterium goheungense]TDO29145.1 hypothetical protein BC659_1228 [Sediminibacterium goheungense]